MAALLTVKHNIEVAHRLSKTPGKCENIHGHSMIVEFSITGAPDKDTGLLVPNWQVLGEANKTPLLTGLGMREGDEWVCAPSISERPSYLHLLDTEPLRPSVLVRTLRHSAHVSRKLLGPKCSKCFNDIDSGTEYFSWAGIVADQFFWYYTHGRC
jgi:hypothetical protein